MYEADVDIPVPPPPRAPRSAHLTGVAACLATAGRACPRIGPLASRNRLTRTWSPWSTSSLESVTIARSFLLAFA